MESLTSGKKRKNGQLKLVGEEKEADDQCQGDDWEEYPNQEQKKHPQLVQESYLAKTN